MADKTQQTGGCQCGAVRFRVEGLLGDASICHCRMCQKAFGSFYAPLVSLGGAKLSWTRGEPARFRSSNRVLRSFCAACGTPLTMEMPEDSLNGVALAIGAFDDPSQLVPVVQWGIESRLPYVDGLHRLPGKETMEDAGSASYLYGLISRQHPDHDTAVWPPRR